MMQLLLISKALKDSKIALKTYHITLSRPAGPTMPSHSWSRTLSCHGEAPLAAAEDMHIRNVANLVHVTRSYGCG